MDIFDVLTILTQVIQFIQGEHHNLFAWLRESLFGKWSQNFVLIQKRIWNSKINRIVKLKDVPISHPHVSVIHPQF